MNRRELFKTACAAAFVAGLPAAADATTMPFPSQRKQLLCNDGWRFHEGDLAMPVLIGHDETYNAAKAGNALGAASPSYDDSDWAEVQLPHDFASFQPIEQGANVDQGYRRRGIAWYRNNLRFEENDRGQHIELQLEGVATHATVWFNGTLVARNWSGYASAYIDITPYVTYGEAFNSLVVRVDAREMEGWWYEGGGIYRDIWIVKRNPVHIVTDGVFAHPVQGGDKWVVPIEVTVYNSGKQVETVHVASDIWDDSGIGGREFGNSQTITVPPLETAVARYTVDVFSPHLWSIEDPHLYQVTTTVMQGDLDIAEYQHLDEVIVDVGFRTQRFDAKTGFYLNDKHVKLKGVCLHQDHAGVGTAVPDGLIDFRLRKLKSLGCNAIRMSHNAQNRALMDACDRHGFLVMAENRNFNPSSDYMEQLEWLVCRDRNHPSIILWSVFNEEPMQGSEAGYEMVRRMSAAVKRLDTSRSVTAAMNGGLFTPLNVSHAVDVVGINYQQDQYDPFHAAYPDKPLTSSEDASAFMTRGEFVTDKDKHILAGYDDEAAPWGATHRAAWKRIAQRDFVAGGFVWTGFDYHGEPTPHTWPTNSSFFGIFDLCGFDKPAVHIHRAQWIDDKPTLGLEPHWNWTAGQRVRVMACTNAEEVELFVNGKSAGRQKGDRLEMNYWTVPYAAGHIEARAYNGGKVVEKARRETTGKAVALRLTSEGSGYDARPLTVAAVDAKGRIVPEAADMIRFEAEGCAIIGLGNGDPNCLEAEKGDRRSLFHGLAQVIVRQEVTKWSVVRATAPGLKPASITLEPHQGGGVSQSTAPTVQTYGNWFRAPDGTSPDAAPDFATWQWFRAGELFAAATSDGEVRVATSLKPFKAIQAKGGVLEFLDITGAADIYVDGQKAGSKDYADAGKVRVPLSPGDSHTVVVAFRTVAGQRFGFGRDVRVRS
ncbi:hypothetical protein ABAC460_16300 [Asticcacaulis sp. AC460]|uniref:beta-galactosidase GalA n=1 Tax=Asticcacaulis sp. AC460 TaxID=1282360 RepID=UPI0003C40D5E|nr:beta-galactosidase GalA [Asticcacaulis sp. AC460]ESQ88222.1 hypothetical protein ABAC460_16300 [Asticcacaulis sp. AC460]